MDNLPDMASDGWIRKAVLWEKRQRAWNQLLRLNPLLAHSGLDSLARMCPGMDVAVYEMDQQLGISKSIHGNPKVTNQTCNKTFDWAMILLPQ